MTRSQENQTYNTDVAQQQQANNQANASLAPVMATDQSILANPGYSPGTQSAITNNTMGAVNSAYGAAENKATNNVAKTNNAAGYNDVLDQLARQRGQAVSTATNQDQVQFANNAQQQTDQAVKSLQGLYGLQTGASDSLLNQQGTVGAQNKGFWDTIGGPFAEGFGGALGKSL